VGSHARRDGWMQRTPLGAPKIGAILNRNILNHGITFEEAAEVFFDPFTNPARRHQPKCRNSGISSWGIRAHNAYYWWCQPSDPNAHESFLPD
jgi:hypothetical protein